MGLWASMRCNDAMQWKLKYMSNINLVPHESCSSNSNNKFRDTGNLIYYAYSL